MSDIFHASCLEIYSVCEFTNKITTQLNSLELTPTEVHLIRNLNR